MADLTTFLIILADILLKSTSVIVLLKIRTLRMLGRNTTMTLFMLSMLSGLLFIILAPLGLGILYVVVPFLLSDLFLLLALAVLGRSLRKLMQH